MGPLRDWLGGCLTCDPNGVVIRGISPFRPTHPVRAKNDCVRQVSWLPGHCSCPAFPDDIQWHEGPELAGHSCGGSAGSRTRVHFRLPFSSTDRTSTRLNSITNAHLVCRLLLEIKKT